ncbi:diguanylate cyclase [Chitinibacteraceae bacterium HSL-7]
MINPLLMSHAACIAFAGLATFQYLDGLSYLRRARRTWALGCLLLAFGLMCEALVPDWASHPVVRALSALGQMGGLALQGQTLAELLDRPHRTVLLFAPAPISAMMWLAMPWWGELAAIATHSVMLVLLFGIMARGYQRLSARTTSTRSVASWLCAAAALAFCLRLAVLSLFGLELNAWIDASEVLIYALAATASLFSSFGLILHVLMLRTQHWRHKAAHDTLTGAANREHLAQLLLERSALDDDAVVALFDLDHFKRVNDQYGHDVGDVVLRIFSDLARSEVRGSDTVARWGGEEFCLYLPATQLEHGIEIIERIRVAVEELDLGKVAKGLHCTCSAGVTQWRATTESFDTALARADTLLYQAKSDGRNRVCDDLQATVKPEASSSIRV